MEWYHIFKSDVITSYRIFKNRVKKHPFITIFFGIVAILGTRLTVVIGLYLDNLDYGENPVLVERWVFSIIFFSFILGKVALYTYRKVLKEREMLSIFSQPINLLQIAIGKYLANLFYIAVLILTGFFLFYIWLWLSLGPIGIPLDILAEGILLGFLALSLGFTLPVFLQLKPMSKKIVNLSSNVLIIGAVSIPVRFFAHDAWFFIILMGLTLVSFALVIYSSKFLLESWTAQLSKPLAYTSTPDKDRLLTESSKKELISRETWIIAKKEIITLIREKDAILTIGAAIFLTIASVTVYLYYGPQGITGSSIGGYIYPGLLVVFLFLGTVMLSALIGLAMISMEGRAFYIIKLLPVSNLEVLKGKSLALLIFSFPIILPMSFLLPIVAKFPVPVTIFFILFSIMLIISFTGIGIWGGAKFPNFDPTARNMPDLISQFFIIWICIFTTLFLGGIPAYLMAINYSIGIVAMLVAIGWGVTIFICSLNLGQNGYDKIGSDMYM